ncbi:hypothetical protein SPSIL_006860 [Sporomusa silvacetica DSM 10669]|uniref:HTH arsR-type domain-containing protein n=1 Tax=Sporomusa silvacetica DSM 10669 TaxID=1123289 RepID=A0ABZ3IFX5_9FIRM|nr:ArsR family transcriptional regulator [Sporomusa silvacetica]OZC16438.1 DNA-binding transcriptional repressor ArsR [Sporomusa silvacetica DSM 10669]
MDIDMIKIFKALGNETRLNILLWLKEPTKYFGPQMHLTVVTDFPGGVCVQSIQKKASLSQSTISNFLASLEEAGLLESKKINQYTYFRRNEIAIQEIKKWIDLEI